MLGVVRLAVIALALLALSGCADAEPPVTIAAWTLVAGHEERDIVLPAHVEIQRAPAYALRARVAIPPAMRGRILTFAFAHLPARAVLKTGGRRAPALELPSEDGYREPGVQRWRIAEDLSDTEQLALELTIDDTWQQATWLDTVPRLSPTMSGDAWTTAVVVTNEKGAAIGFATTIFTCVSFLGLYLLDRRRRAHGWQAVQSLGAAAYPAFALGVLQPLLGPNELLVVMLGIVVAALAGLEYTFAQFKLGPFPKRTWLALVVVVIVWALTGRYASARWLALTGNVLVLTATAYHFVLVVRALRRRPIETNLVLSSASWSIVATLSIPDFSSILGLGEPLGGLHPACIGIAIVSAIYTTAFVRDHIASLKATEALNVELRRQIAARSEHLANAIAGVGTSASLERGDVVDGRYRIERAIGSGGMGAVYEVTRTSDDKRLALKVLQREQAAPATLARFAREAQIACQVDHPNVVAVVDIGVARSGVLYLVMEYADGPSLAELHDKFGDAAWATKVLRPIAAGLEALHARGIVHRDLKPSNVLVSSGVAKIADFGVSKLLDAVERESRLPLADTVEDDASLTKTGVIVGTPLYMAPEAAKSARDASPASDVWSFGVIAFELFTGTRPFDDASAVARLHGVSLKPPARLATARPELDRALAKLVDRCLSQSPDERPTARELASAFAEHDTTGRAAIA